MKSQIVISSWGGLRRAAPYAFTEQGVAMLSSVLSNPKAIHVNVEIMRAFVRLRRLLASPEDLARKFDDLENRYDAQFKTTFDAIRSRQSVRRSAENRKRGSWNSKQLRIRRCPVPLRYLFHRKGPLCLGRQRGEL